MPFFPINFSIPKCKIVNNIPKKTKILSNLIPGVLSTYIYTTEEDYYNEYQQSLFAITMKKAGWDCLRHYEIMANGCIPVFIDINNCPQNCLALNPKNLYIEANLLYSKYKDKNVNSLTNEEYEECYNLIYKFLYFLKNNLTSDIMAQYILRKTNNENIKSVLYLSKDPSPDYLRCLTLIGFKELFGDKCHDYIEIPHIYKNNNIQYNKLYGKGISYTKLFEKSYRNKSNDYTVEQDIINHKYDIIVYGSMTRGLPFFDLVQKYYNPSNIILLNGEDELYTISSNDKNSNILNIFIREIK
jgi:hypothetical protein